MSYDTEGRYFTTEIMIKESPGHTLDDLWNLIEEWLPECSEDECTCGMVHMGGCSGTEEQCWKHLGQHESLALVKSADLKLALHRLAADEGMDDEAYERLRKEAYWYEDYDTWVASLPDDDEEKEFELDPEVAPYFSDEPLPSPVLSHLEHYQTCNCLSDSGTCCRENCSTCKGD